MGRLRERLESRQGSETGPTLGDLLWIFVNFFLFVVGLAVLWRSGGGWGAVLRWASYGIPWIVSVACIDHLLARWRRRREPIAAGRPWRAGRAWVIAAFFNLALLVAHLKLNRYASERVLFVILWLGLLAIVLSVRIVARIRQRREAARRKQEADDLARQF